MASTKITDSLEFPQSASPLRAVISIGVVGVVASIVGFALNKEQFLLSYLTSFSFFISIALASLFLVMIHHITRSSWGVTIRRIPETFSSYIWVFALLFIPVLFGIETLYTWTQEQYSWFYEGLREHKSPYLNIPFFIARNILYFGIWSYLGYTLYKKSVAMDNTGDWGIDTAMRKVSAPGIFLFAFTVAFASFDWIMSLNFDWFSTMFGVYYFAMSFQALFAVLILMALYLRKQGLLLNTITKAHIRDLGAWMFAFTVFYAYIAFGQFFLIYYASIPEEALYYITRLEGNWDILAYMILFGRFVIPFIILLPAKAKGNFKILLPISALIVFIHFVELFWLVMPSHHETFHFSWIDVATFLAFAGLFLGLFFHYFQKNSMVPKNDPKLSESLNKH